MPMPVHGARATDGAFQTAAIPRSSNARPPFSAWGDFAGQIHSPEPPMGRAPGAGIPPARRGVTGVAIRYVRGRLLAKWPLNGPRSGRHDAYGTQLKRLRNGLRIFAGGIATFVECRCRTVKHCRS